MSSAAEHPDPARRPHRGDASAPELSRRSFLGLGAGATALGLAALPLGGLLSACSSSSGSSGGSGGSFRIGWAAPFTGALYGSSYSLSNAGLVAIREINAKGGIMGKKISRDDFDDQSLPANEPGGVIKAAGKDISYYLGPDGSSLVEAALPMLTSKKILSTGYASSDDFADGTKYPYWYQFVFSTANETQIAVKYLVETLKKTKVAILQEDTALGQAATEGSKAALKKYGITPITVQVYPISATDLTPYLSKIKSSGANGILGWLATAQNAAQLGQAQQKLNFDVPICGANGLFAATLLQLAPPSALKNLYGVHYKTLSWTASEQPAARQVAYSKAVMAEKLSSVNGPASAASPYYDFLYLLKSAVEKNKSFDVGTIKKEFDSTTDFDGILGKVSFTKENHAGIQGDDLTLCTVVSGNDSRGKGERNAFRERAPGL